VAVGGTKACVVNFSSSTLQLFDVSGTTPVLLGSAPTNTNPSDVAISGNKAFVISFGGLISLQIFDISGTTPTFLGAAPIGIAGYRVIVRNERAYITTGDNKLAVYDVSGNTPAHLGFAATGSGPTDFVLNGNRAYVVNRAANAFQVFDISNNNPVLLATTGTEANPRGIVVTGNRAYVANFSAKTIQVFDLGVTLPVSVGSAAVDFNPERILVNGNRLYAVGNNSMLNVYDADGRYKPVLIGRTPLANAATGKSLYLTERKAYVGTSDKKLQVFELGFSGSITAIGSDGGLVVVPDASLGGDNLGDHSVTQNLNLRNFQLVGNDGSSGIQISNTGNVGIGTSTPHAPLQFSNTPQARKIVLAEEEDNDHSFSGFGTEALGLRYQVGSTTRSHIFYAGASPSASTELMRITGTGRVGLGTANPLYKLDVAGNSQVKGDFIHTSDDGGGTWVYLNNTNAVPVGWKLVTQASPSAGTGGNLLFYNTNNNAALTVQQNGYIGVGLSNPATLFTNTASNILGGSGTGLGLGSMAWQTNGGGFVHGIYNQNTAYNANGLVVKIAGTAASNRILDLATGATQDAPGTSLLVVQGDGNVGIGTGSPAQKLDVQGNIAASGNFVMGVQYVSSAHSIPSNGNISATCQCPAGTKVIGGGGGHSGFTPSQSDIKVNFTGPQANGSSWQVLANNTSNSTRQIDVWAICARVQ
jgi:hypothetical protein